MKCSVYIATSVDGFIAKTDGDIGWLHSPKFAEAKLNGLDYEDFISTVDAIIMGRNSYEKALTFGFWPYENIPVIILTSRSLDVPKELREKIRIENLAPEQLVSRLEDEGYKHLYIDGGKTIQGFLKAGLINEITITRIPILLGSGIPLFGELNHPLPVHLLAAFSSDNGFVQVRYKVGQCA